MALLGVLFCYSTIRVAKWDAFFRYQCIGSAGGEHAFIHAYAFFAERQTVQNKRHDIDAILNGEPVELPDEVDLQYAVAAALTRRAKTLNPSGDKGKQALENILTFATKFPQREIGVMLVSYLHRILEGELFKLDGFTHWAEDAAGLLVE